MSQFFFGQSDEAYQWRVCYQRGLPRLVFVSLDSGLSRRFFRDIGHFILPLIASQMKIQIFIRSRDLLCSFGRCGGGGGITSQLKEKCLPYVPCCSLCGWAKFFKPCLFVCLLSPPHPVHLRDAGQDLLGGVRVQRHPRDGGPPFRQQLGGEEGERHDRLPEQVKPMTQTEKIPSYGNWRH